MYTAAIAVLFLIASIAFAADNIGSKLEKGAVVRTTSLSVLTLTFTLTLLPFASYPAAWHLSSTTRCLDSWPLSCSLLTWQYSGGGEALLLRCSNQLMETWREWGQSQCRHSQSWRTWTETQNQQNETFTWPSAIRMYPWRQGPGLM